MVEVPKIRHQLGALVIRADKPQNGFTWELREYGKAEALQASDRLYASYAEARRAADDALMVFKASGK